MAGGRTRRRGHRLSRLRWVLPLLGNALRVEDAAVLSRTTPVAHCPIRAAERPILRDALVGIAEWLTVCSLWRPELPDDGDIHLIELAFAGAAD
jgi:hypothetical protein